MPSSPTFGGFTFGTKLWGGGANAAAMFSTDALVFYDADGNAFSLSDNESMILTDLGPIGPSREIIGGSVPRDHGQFVNADYFRETVIEARGIAKKSTAALLDAFLDTMKKALRDREGSVDVIDQAGTVKRYTVTVDNYEAMFPRKRYHITFCPWVVRFRCKTPFGRSRTYDTAFSTLSSSPTNLTVDHGGTVRAQPVITRAFRPSTRACCSKLRVRPRAGSSEPRTRSPHRERSW